jgi:hypothetical protein
MYREIRIVNTYACRNAISNSRNIIAVTITHGNTARIAITEPEVISAHEKPIRIFSKA